MTYTHDSTCIFCNGEFYYIVMNLKNTMIKYFLMTHWETQKQGHLKIKNHSLTLSLNLYGQYP